MSRSQRGPRWYLVCSPEYQIYAQQGFDLAEYGCSCSYVRTTTRRRAVVMAVKHWDRSYPKGCLGPSYSEAQRSDALSPFTGVRVEQEFSLEEAQHVEEPA